MTSMKAFIDYLEKASDELQKLIDESKEIRENFDEAIINELTNQNGTSH